jgi:hypothetical protein
MPRSIRGNLFPEHDPAAFRGATIRSFPGSPFKLQLEEVAASYSAVKLLTTMLVCVGSFCAWNVAAADQNPNTDWLSKARLGIFMHFLPSDSKTLELVRDFDTDAVANQLGEIGVDYFVITLGQNSGYFNSPNAAYDKRTGNKAGERCSTRDLPLDLVRALQPKKIRLMLYLPCQTPNQDAKAQKAFGLSAGPQDQRLDLPFAKKWAEVIDEWSTRYGDKVSGWWFDGGYDAVRFDEDMAELYSAAVKHGNSNAIVTFNPGVQVTRHTDAEDYTAGELNEPFDFVPESRWLEGAQWHALTYLGSNWMKRDTRYPVERWISWVKSVKKHEGAVTIDMGPNYDPAVGPIGCFSELQFRQAKAIGASLQRR